MGLSQAEIDAVDRSRKTRSRASNVPWNDEGVLTALDPLGIGIKPHATRQIEAEAQAGWNPYTAQLQKALGGIRGRDSAAETLTGLNMDRLARSGAKSMRGGSPLSAAVSLGRLSQAQAQVGQAGGRAMGAEQQRMNAVLGGAYGRQAQFALKNALAEAQRRKAIDLANKGLIEDANAMMVQRAAVLGEQGAEAWGKYRANRPPERSMDPLSEDFEWGSYTSDVGG